MVSLEMTKSLRSLGLVKFFSNSAGLTQKCICSQCGGVCECVVEEGLGGALQDKSKSWVLDSQGRGTKYPSGQWPLAHTSETLEISDTQIPSALLKKKKKKDVASIWSQNKWPGFRGTIKGAVQCQCLNLALAVPSVPVSLFPAPSFFPHLSLPAE